MFATFIYLFFYTIIIIKRVLKLIYNHFLNYTGQTSVVSSYIYVLLVYSRLR